MEACCHKNSVGIRIPNTQLQETSNYGNIYCPLYKWWVKHVIILTIWIVDMLVRYLDEIWSVNHSIHSQLLTIWIAVNYSIQMTFVY